MFTTLVLAFTLGVAVADFGRGYQYQVPVNPFGASSSQVNNYNKGVYSVSSNPALTFGRGSSLTTGTVGPGIGSTIYKQGSSVSSGFGGQASVVPSTTFSQSSKGSVSTTSQSASGSYGTYGQGQGPTSTGVSSSSLTGSFSQGSVVPGTSFSQGSKQITSFGQTTLGSSGLGQGSVVSPIYTGQLSSGNTGYNNNGFSSTSSSQFGIGSGSGYKVVNPSVLSTKYVTGSTGPSSNYYGTTGGSNSGFAVPASGTGSYYNTGSSTGSNFVQQPSYTGSNSNYNTPDSGSTYYVPNQQGVYPGSTVGQNQGSYQTIVDTSALDNIGNYYQSASAANQFISSNQYQNAAILNYQDYYNQIQQQPAQVFKHFYVHAAPEDLEPPKPRPQIILPPPQKHYKIIFIKAPTQQPSVPQVIPVPQQNEEKTIVYVLVKKPEDAKNIVLPKFEQNTPVKPDVFFIKYNDKQDSQSLIDNIVNDYNKGGVSATFTDISGGVPASSGSGYKTGSSLVTSTSSVNNNPVKSTGTTVETLFGKKPTVGSSFGTSTSGLSSTTPSTSFTSGTLSPSSFSSVFDNRFGISTDNKVNSGSTGSGSSVTTSNLVVKPSSGTLLSGNTLSSKPSVSYGSVSDSNLGSKPVTSFTSGSSSTFGSNVGIPVNKPSSTLLIGSNTFSAGSKPSSVPVTSSYISNVPSYGSGSSGIISGSKGNTQSSSGFSLNSKPSVSFGSVSGNNLGSKPVTSFTSGSSSTFGSNVVIPVNKPSSTLLTGSNTFSAGSKPSSVPVTSSYISNVPSYGSSTQSSSGFSLNSNDANSKPNGNFGTGSSVVTSNINNIVLPSSSFGLSSSTPGYNSGIPSSRPSTVNSVFGSSSTSGNSITLKPVSNSGLSSVATTSGSFPSTIVSSTPSPAPNALSSINNYGSGLGSVGSGNTLPSGSSSSTFDKISTVYVSKPIVSGVTLNKNPSNSGSSFSNIASPALSLSNGVESSQSSNSYSTGLSNFNAGTTSGSSTNFGVGSSKFGVSSGLDKSAYETTIVSTSQGIPHETYGIPKFKVL